MMLAPPRLSAQQNLDLDNAGPPPLLTYTSLPTSQWERLALVKRKREV